MFPALILHCSVPESRSQYDPGTQQSSNFLHYTNAEGWTWTTYLVLGVFPPFTSQKTCFKQTQAHPNTFLPCMYFAVCSYVAIGTSPPLPWPAGFPSNLTRKKKHQAASETKKGTEQIYMTRKNSWNFTSLLTSVMPLPLQTKTPIDLAKLYHFTNLGLLK